MVPKIFAGKDKKSSLLSVFIVCKFFLIYIYAYNRSRCEFFQEVANQPQTNAESTYQSRHFSHSCNGTSRDHRNYSSCSTESNIQTRQPFSGENFFIMPRENPETDKEINLQNNCQVSNVSSHEFQDVRLIDHTSRKFSIETTQLGNVTPNAVSFVINKPALEDSTNERWSNTGQSIFTTAFTTYETHQQGNIPAEETICLAEVCGNGFNPSEMDQLSIGPAFQFSTNLDAVYLHSDSEVKQVAEVLGGAGKDEPGTDISEIAQRIDTSTLEQYKGSQSTDIPLEYRYLQGDPYEANNLNCINRPTHQDFPEYSVRRHPNSISTIQEASFDARCGKKDTWSNAANIKEGLGRQTPQLQIENSGLGGIQDRESLMASLNISQKERPVAHISPFVKEENTTWEANDISELVDRLTAHFTDSIEKSELNVLFLIDTPVKLKERLFREILGLFVQKGIVVQQIVVKVLKDTLSTLYESEKLVDLNLQPVGSTEEEYRPDIIDGMNIHMRATDKHTILSGPNAYLETLQFPTNGNGYQFPPRGNVDQGPIDPHRRYPFTQNGNFFGKLDSATEIIDSPDPEIGSEIKAWDLNNNNDFYSSSPNIPKFRESFPDIRTINSLIENLFTHKNGRSANIIHRILKRILEENLYTGPTSISILNHDGQTGQIETSDPFNDSVRPSAMKSTNHCGLIDRSSRNSPANSIFLNASSNPTDSYYKKRNDITSSDLKEDWVFEPCQDCDVPLHTQGLQSALNNITTHVNRNDDRSLNLCQSESAPENNTDHSLGIESTSTMFKIANQTTESSNNVSHSPIPPHSSTNRPNSIQKTTGTAQPKFDISSTETVPLNILDPPNVHLLDNETSTNLRLEILNKIKESRTYALESKPQNFIEFKSCEKQDIQFLYDFIINSAQKGTLHHQCDQCTRHGQTLCKKTSLDIQSLEILINYINQTLEGSCRIFFDEGDEFNLADTLISFYLTLESDLRMLTYENHNESVYSGAQISLDREKTAIDGNNLPVNLIGQCKASTQDVSTIDCNRVNYDQSDVNESGFFNTHFVSDDMGRVSNLAVERKSAPTGVFSSKSLEDSPKPSEWPNINHISPKAPHSATINDSVSLLRNPPHNITSQYIAAIPFSDSFDRNENAFLSDHEFLVLSHNEDRSLTDTSRSDHSLSDFVFDQEFEMDDFIIDQQLVESPFADECERLADLRHYTSGKKTKSVDPSKNVLKYRRNSESNLRKEVLRSNHLKKQRTTNCSFVTDVQSPPNTHSLESSELEAMKTPDPKRDPAKSLFRSRNRRNTSSGDRTSFSPASISNATENPVVVCQLSGNKDEHTSTSVDVSLKPVSEVNIRSIIQSTTPQCEYLAFLVEFYALFCFLKTDRSEWDHLQLQRISDRIMNYYNPSTEMFASDYVADINSTIFAPSDHIGTKHQKHRTSGKLQSCHPSPYFDLRSFYIEDFKVDDIVRFFTETEPHREKHRVPQSSEVYDVSGSNPNVLEKYSILGSIMPVNLSHTDLDSTAISSNQPVNDTDTGEKGMSSDILSQEFDHKDDTCFQSLGGQKMDIHPTKNGNLPNLSHIRNVLEGPSVICGEYRLVGDDLVFFSRNEP